MAKERRGGADQENGAHLLVFTLMKGESSTAHSDPSLTVYLGSSDTERHGEKEGGKKEGRGEGR